MIKRVYALRDVKVGFLSPTIADSDALAIRDLESACLSGAAGLLATHAKDFALYYLGTYDTDSGYLNSLLPEFVKEVSDFYAV